MRRKNSDMCLADGPPCKKISSNNVTSTADIRPGEILTDIAGKKWKLGKAVGVGGFGEIFLASDNIDNPSDTNFHYVAKVETHTNGPLFVEINCYLRIARKHMVDNWKNENNMDALGMPVYVASGSHETKGSKFRFLIIPRFEKDLEQVLQSKKHKFNLKTVLIIGMQLLSTLEYIHSKGYVHSDIKASNILLQKSKKDKLSKGIAIRHAGGLPLRSCRARKLALPHALRPNENIKYYDLSNGSAVRSEADQVYLLDYGLATKYIRSNGEHKQFCSDERRAHAGTILFCSLDAHKGAQSRRSDLESLGYNMIYWLTSELPWMDDIEEPEIVHKKKQKCLTNLDEFLKCCFLNGYPKFLYEYFKYLVELGFETDPDYNYCKLLFEKGLNEFGYKKNFKFDFDNLEGWGKKQKKTKTNSENKKTPKINYKLNRLPLTSNLPIRPDLRKKSKNKINKLNWSKILIDDPEIILKQGKTRDRKITETSENSANLVNLDIYQLNPTYAMIDIYNKSLEKINAGCSPRYKGDSCSDSLEGYTPAMMTVYNRKKEREELELEKIYVNSKNINSRLNNRSTRRNNRMRQESRFRNSKSSHEVRKDSSKKQKSVNTRAHRLRG